MNDTELERLRRQFGGEENITPPGDLLARLKNDIPDETTLRDRAKEPEPQDHPATWRLAASVLMLFGFAFVAARIYLESRHDRYAASPATYAPAAAPVTAADEAVPSVASSPRASEGETSQLHSETAPADRLFRAKKEAAPAVPAAAPPQLAANEMPPLAKTNESGETEGSLSADSSLRERDLKDDARADRPARAQEEPAAAAAVAEAPAAPPAATYGAARAAAAQPQSKAAAVEEKQHDERAKIYRVGGDVLAPRLLHEVPLVVTSLERKTFRGDLLVDLVVRSDGSVGDVRIVNAPEELRERLLQSVRTRRYRPATLDGRAVDVEIRSKVRLEVR